MHSISDGIENSNESEDFEVLEKCLLQFTETVADCLYDMIVSKYGSFVGRTLLCILSGRDVRNKKKETFEKSDQNKTTKDTESAEVALNSINKKTFHGKLEGRMKKQRGLHAANESRYIPRYPAMLRKIAEVTMGDDWTGENLKEVQVDSFAGPFLQSLLRSVAGWEDELVIKLLVHILGGNATVGPESLSPDLIKELITNKQGSHLIEAALEAAPDEIFNKLCTLAFKGNIADLAKHPVANFAVQSAFASVKRNQQFKRMFEDLRPDIGNLLELRRGGVVATLVATSGRLRYQRAEVADSIWASIGSAKSFKSKTPVHFLLTLDTTAQINESGSGKKLSTLGCLILSEIFGLVVDDEMDEGLSLALTKWSEAIRTLSHDELFRIACDSGGCRVLEQYLKGLQTSKKKKQEIFEALSGKWAEIAHSGAGCRFVENCFMISDAVVKEKIASELAVAESRIASVYGGPALLSFCHVKSYKSGAAKEWKQRITSADSTRKEFEELFG